MKFDSPPPEPLASAIGFLLAWNGERVGRRLGEALRTLGLRRHHFGVLTLLGFEPGLTQQELVARSMIDASSMVSLLDELERLGLAERRPHPGDRRKHAVHLTAAGKRKLAQARKLAVSVTEDLLAPLDERERDALRGLLRKLAGL